MGFSSSALNNRRQYGSRVVPKRKHRATKPRPTVYRKAIIAFLRERDGWICQVCKSPLNELWPHIDHKISRAKGGSDTLGNFQLTHAFCNMSKGDKWYWKV